MKLATKTRQPEFIFTRAEPQMSDPELEYLIRYRAFNGGLFFALRMQVRERIALMALEKQWVSWHDGHKLLFMLRDETYNASPFIAAIATQIHEAAVKELDKSRPSYVVACSAPRSGTVGATAASVEETEEEDPNKDWNFFIGNKDARIKDNLHVLIPSVLIPEPHRYADKVWDLCKEKFDKKTAVRHGGKMMESPWISHRVKQIVWNDIKEMEPKIDYEILTSVLIRARTTGNGISESIQVEAVERYHDMHTTTIKDAVTANPERVGLQEAICGKFLKSSAGMCLSEVAKVAGYDWMDKPKKKLHKRMGTLLNDQKMKVQITRGELAEMGLNCKHWATVEEHGSFAAIAKTTRRHAFDYSFRVVNDPNCPRETGESRTEDLLQEILKESDSSYIGNDAETLSRLTSMFEYCDMTQCEQLAEWTLEKIILHHRGSDQNRLLERDGRLRINSGSKQAKYDAYRKALFDFLQIALDCIRKKSIRDRLINAVIKFEPDNEIIDTIMFNHPEYRKLLAGHIDTIAEALKRLLS